MKQSMACPRVPGELPDLQCQARGRSRLRPTRPAAGRSAGWSWRSGRAATACLPSPAVACCGHSTKVRLGSCERPGKSRQGGLSLHKQAPAWPDHCCWAKRAWLSTLPQPNKRQYNRQGCTICMHTGVQHMQRVKRACRQYMQRLGCKRHSTPENTVASAIHTHHTSSTVTFFAHPCSWFADSSSTFSCVRSA